MLRLHAIRVICGGENGTNGCHLAVSSLDVALSHHFVVPHPLATPYKSAQWLQ